MYVSDCLGPQRGAWPRHPHNPPRAGSFRQNRTKKGVAPAITPQRVHDRGQLELEHAGAPVNPISRAFFHHSMAGTTHTIATNSPIWIYLLTISVLKHTL